MGGIIASAFAPTSLAAKPPPAESFAAGGSAKAFLPSRSSFDLLLVFHSLALPIDVGGLVRWEGFAGLPFSVGLAAERALGDAVMACQRLSAQLMTPARRPEEKLQLYVQHIQIVLFKDA